MPNVISTPQAFKQGDVTRVIKAAANAGAKSVRFTIGKLIVEVPLNPDAPPTPPTPAPPNEDTTSGAA